MKNGVLVLLAIVLIGCATAGKHIEVDKLSRIKEGFTTRQEVIDLLGKPEIVSLSSDAKEVMTYQHLKYKTRPSTFIPIVGLMTGGADMEQQVLQVLIDRNGIVEKYVLSDLSSAVNAGLFNQR